jgi:hypothetical protein
MDPGVLDKKAVTGRFLWGVSNKQQHIFRAALYGFDRRLSIYGMETVSSLCLGSFYLTDVFCSEKHAAEFQSPERLRVLKDGNPPLTKK